MPLLWMESMEHQISIGVLSTAAYISTQLPVLCRLVLPEKGVAD